MSGVPWNSFKDFCVFVAIELRSVFANVFQSCKHLTLKAAFLSNLTQNFKLEFIDSFAPIIISTTSAETNNVMARGRSSFAEIQCKQKIVVYVLIKPSHGDFWRLINQWVFVNFKIWSHLLDLIWLDFMKLDGTLLTVVKFHCLF